MLFIQRTGLYWLTIRIFGEQFSQNDFFFQLIFPSKFKENFCIFGLFYKNIYMNDVSLKRIQIDLNLTYSFVMWPIPPFLYRILSFLLAQEKLCWERKFSSQVSLCFMMTKHPFSINIKKIELSRRQISLAIAQRKKNISKNATAPMKLHYYQSVIFPFTF